MSDQTQPPAESDRATDVTEVPQPEAPPAATPQWAEPTVTFVEPKLTTHGNVAGITAQQGFFGTFIPDA